MDDPTNTPTPEQQAANIAQLCHDAGHAGSVLTLACHSLAMKSGRWIDPTTGEDILVAAGRWAPFVEATKLALIGTEVSESIEGHRKGAMDDKLPHRTMTEVELADIVIRVFDYAGRKKLDVGGAIAEKLMFNQTRADDQVGERVKAGGKAY